nr:hypothetical protein [Tanacetum cinerariifolium]
YTAIPPLIAQLYLSPKKDLSWIGLPECADNTVTDYNRPSPIVESTQNHLQNSSPSASETGASDSILSKPAVKFVKAAERPTTDKVETAKKPTVRYAELYRKTTKRACFNSGHVDHLSYDCGLGVKKGTTKPQNNTHMSMPPRPAIHRPYRPPMRPKVQRLERELKAKTPIQKIDRVRSMPVMAWVPKQVCFLNRKLRNRIGILSEDKKKQRNKKLEDLKAEHQV